MPEAHNGVRVLIIRAWSEPDHDEGLRVRILEPAGADRAEQHLVTTPSVAAACHAVCAWLAELEERAP